MTVKSKSTVNVFVDENTGMKTENKQTKKKKERKKKGARTRSRIMKRARRAEEEARYDSQEQVPSYNVCGEKTGKIKTKTNKQEQNCKENRS